ncbi:MAG TPA: UDP-N-acetylmuramoyl-L-alanyl-D-glutamate--2,6-diaminopimelate ligase [Candidatus Saccharibacteria bacterium]|nr:UDP-N-acetylmuramoyl-L-alanyl-D-glutamate--2,6-diaminopimelate ligase [Candidatus Saccharibacteria bacterium]
MVNLRSIVKRLIPSGFFKKIEPTGHLIESVLVNIRFGFPSRKMHVIGVTGTNGKTTTAFMIHKMLTEAGYKTALLSTVAYGIGNDINSQSVHMTTESAPIMQKRIKGFKRAGVEWLVLETSSHALAQNRIWGIPYEVAVMTNITGDHLDYHGTFEEYVRAKLKLFQIAAHHGMKLGVVNADDSSADRFINAVPSSVTYGIDNGEVKASKLKLGPSHSTFEVKAGSDKYNMRVNIPGKFNVSNALAAVVVGRALGLGKSQIESGVAALEGVEGRMMSIDAGQKFRVLIDFASTPDGFERFFESIRPATKGKLIAVFGSAGRRDEAKRAVQGKIAGKNADEVIITEEDDRDVDGQEIMDQIASGAKKAGLVADKNLFMVHNREEAIGFALTRAKSSQDTVVFLGKGHEKTIERADGEYPWNESEAVRTAIEQMLAQSKSD